MNTTTVGLEVWTLQSQSSRHRGRFAKKVTSWARRRCFLQGGLSAFIYPVHLVGIEACAKVVRPHTPHDHHHSTKKEHPWPNT